MNILSVWDNFSYMQNLHKRWWFWVSVIALLVFAVYLKGYFDWYLAGAKYRYINANAQAYIASQEKQQAALEAQYKNDPYGGATPEATLKLFIEALEKKDYTLASNYFIPEKVAEYRKDFPEAEASGGVGVLVSAYAKGRKVSEKYEGQEKFEIKVFPENDSVPFIFTIIKNPFTNKWLIQDY